MHMWHYVTNHLIISNDKDVNSENRIKLCVRDTDLRFFCVAIVTVGFLIFFIVIYSFKAD
jgi:hypothetical protein